MSCVTATGLTPALPDQRPEDLSALTAARDIFLKLKQVSGLTSFSSEGLKTFPGAWFLQIMPHVAATDSDKVLSRGTGLPSVYIPTLIQNSSRNKAVSCLQPGPRLLAAAKIMDRYKMTTVAAVQFRADRWSCTPAWLPAPLPASFSEENAGCSDI